MKNNKTKTIAAALLAGASSGVALAASPPVTHYWPLVKEAKADNRQSTDAAHRVLQAARSSANANIEYYAGLLREHGWGVQANYAKATYWYKKAAEQGQVNAEFHLGYAYQHAEGVPRNYAKATYWYKKAAEQGSAHAETNLGTAYVKGHGVPPNVAQAIYWYKKAAEQGSAHAENFLGIVYQGQSTYWFIQAAAQGYAPAEMMLAYAYQHGLGINQSRAKATYWYKKAKAAE